ncbi:hypothetical protein QP185_22075 [Sphingomonas aerolata]|uniref:hypothetical protein n=1 Tax=Sphingomonas aerolata TaxID=185951 RepID=UPI002FE1938E
MIQAPVTGAPVQLGDVADIEIAPALNEVKRENGQRRLDVTMNVAGRGPRHRRAGCRCRSREGAVRHRLSP